MVFSEYLGRIAFRALIWALAGALFGGIFAGLGEAFEPLGVPRWQPLALAAGLGGAITASFFGAMQVSLIGTMVGVLTAIGYLVMMHRSANLAAVMAVAAFAGAVAGAALSTRRAIQMRPLGQILSGLVSGMVAGPATFLLARVAGVMDDTLLVSALAVAFVGVFFILSSRWILSLCSEWISAKLSGPLVAAINSTSVAACMWLIASTAVGVGGTVAAESLDRILFEVPFGLIGGAMGGAIGGAMLEALGMERSSYSI